MRRSIGFALKVTALSTAIVSCSIAPAFGQYVKWLGDTYGSGVEGTIGRGTDILPWGPSDPRSGGVSSSIAPAFGQYAGRLGDTYGGGVEGTIGRGTNILPGGPSDPRSSGRLFGPAVSRRGSSSVPMRYSTQVTSRPYLTNQHYEPGDGYRYPLYYNPSTRTYFYYPVRR